MPTSSHLPIGLVSVTFRQMEPAGIVKLARKNHLDVIEWGGDVHVPPGDLSRASRVGEMTREASLQVASYGSYYRLGSSPDLPFSTILETALALGAPVIRVWAGNTGSDMADESVWQAVCNEAEQIASLAAESGVRIAMEFHGGTLNDTPTAAQRLWSRLGPSTNSNLYSLWQPLPSLSPAEQDESLEVILPYLSHVHVFQWLPGPPIARRPLAEGVSDWSRWLSVVKVHRPETPALLEFIPNDTPSDFPAEAATLHQLVVSRE